MKIVISEEDMEPSPHNKDDLALSFLENIDRLAVHTGIDDLAHNHDHYLYGCPKNEE